MSTTRPWVGSRALELPRWPVVILFAGAPLWWVTGLMPFVPIGVIGVFGVIMLRSRGVHLMPGTLPMVAFVVWAGLCVIMLDRVMRMVGFGVRWSGLVAACMLLIYIAAAGPSLPRTTVLGAVAVFWGFVVLGGWLAVLVPEGGFTTPMARVMPGAIGGNELVRDLLNPSFAETQWPWGASEPFHRPSAPFPYANSWGAAIAYLTPLMIALRTCLGRWGRTVVVLGIAASIVPAIATSNRGMLVILVVAVTTAVMRMALAGDRRSAAIALVTAALAALVFIGMGGFDAIDDRQAVSTSTEGRAAIYTQTLRETRDLSPVMGFGAPRPSEEIGISLGTQGAAWMYLFSYGFVGLAIFLGFLIGVAARGARNVHDTADAWILGTVVGALVGIWFYGLDFPHLAVVMVAAGLLLRPRTTGAPRAVMGYAHGVR